MAIGGINNDGSGRLTAAEVKAIGTSPLRKTSEKASGIFAKFMSHLPRFFQEYRQRENDMRAFETGDHERMVDFYCGLTDDSTKDLFEPRMHKLAEALALDSPGKPKYVESSELLKRLRKAGIRIFSY